MAFEVMTGQAELEEDLRQADADFAGGDFIDITLELDRCIAAGQWPWREESSAQDGG